MRHQRWGRRQLFAAVEQVNPRFWHIHTEADRRFATWLRRSLTLEDRDMLVAKVAGEVRGYIIAQPSSPLLLPVAHELAPVGIVDDFYDQDFADVSAVSNGGASGAELLAAAESALRGVRSIARSSCAPRHGHPRSRCWNGATIGRRKYGC